MSLPFLGDEPSVSSILTAEEARYLRRFIWYAFLARVATAILLELSGYSVRLAPDELTYRDNSWYLSLFWAGDSLIPPDRLIGKLPPGYFYVNATLFYLFGLTQIPIKLLNAFLGAYAGRYVYLLARGLFGGNVARRALLLFLFFPSLVLWSSLNIRDIWVIFLIVFIAWESLVLLNGYSGRTLLQLSAAIFLLTLFRDHLFFALACPSVAASLIGRKGNVARNFLLASALAGVVVFLLQQGAVAEGTQQRMSLEGLGDLRRTMATGGSAFAIDADISTPIGAITFLPVGLAYFLFSPFPWQITSALKAFSVPEMLLTYYLVPAVARGIRYTIRYRLRESLQVLMVTGLLAVTYALGEGNVGTLYRHRAQSTAFFLIFAGLGFQIAHAKRTT